MVWVASLLFPISTYTWFCCLQNVVCQSDNCLSMLPVGLHLHVFQFSLLQSGQDGIIGTWEIKKHERAYPSVTKWCWLCPGRSMPSAADRLLCPPLRCTFPLILTGMRGLDLLLISLTLCTCHISRRKYNKMCEMMRHAAAGTARPAHYCTLWLFILW